MMNHGTVRAEAMSGTSAKTVWQLLAGTNHAVRLAELSISFEGVANDGAPILVELLRQSNDGTGTPYILKPLDNEKSNTFDTTANVNYSGEPASPGDVLKAWRIHPQGGLLLQSHDLSEVIIGGGTALALRVTAAVSVGYETYASIEE